MTSEGPIKVPGGITAPSAKSSDMTYPVDTE